MPKKIYIKDKYVSYGPSFTKGRRQVFFFFFHEFIGLTLLNKFLLLKYKWSQFPFEAVQWYAINILSKHFSIPESYSLFTRRADRRKRGGESCNLHKVSSNSLECEVAKPLVSKEEQALCCFSPMRRMPQRPTESTIFKLCGKMQAIAQL